MKKTVGRISLKSRKKRTQSSRDWLLRQLNDPFVQQAKVEGYRSRAAFKLLEIDEKYKILKPGYRVIDLGAAPGGWTQIIAKKVLPKGVVVALDLQDIVPFSETVTIIKGDFEEDIVQHQLAEYMAEADVIVSDMAAAACGIPAVDHLRIGNLLEAAINFSTKHLTKGGSFVAKVLMGGTEAELLKLLKLHFSQVFHFKPNSSRKDSAEMYVVAKGFKGKNTA
ncbi:MAG: RlmE family RNA methyltransferase [Proteobacteria bacterium]|nr:RlmE family RNA methyltransferase [Pseudomonadota bacterium]